MRLPCNVVDPTGKDVYVVVTEGLLGTSHAYVVGDDGHGGSYFLNFAPDSFWPWDLGGMPGEITFNTNSSPPLEMVPEDDTIIRTIDTDDTTDEFMKLIAEELQNVDVPYHLVLKAKPTNPNINPENPRWQNKDGEESILAFLADLLGLGSSPNPVTTGPTLPPAIVLIGGAGAAPSAGSDILEAINP